MKLYALLYLFLLAPIFISAQTVQAEYKVTKDIYANIDNTGEKKIASLSYTGYLYRKGGKYIYFQKPNYLNDYPDGSIKISKGPNSNYYVGIGMDTVQRLNYKDMDSLIKKYRADVSGRGNVNSNYIQKFDADYFSWEMIPETRIINGLKCQKATLTIMGFPQWIVWFTDKEPMQAGIDNIIGLPGLVVEAECLPLKTHFSLISYTTNQDFPSSVFNPAEFNQPFEKVYDMKKSNNQTPQKTKLQKLSELTNQ